MTGTSLSTALRPEELDLALSAAELCGLELSLDERVEDRERNALGRALAALVAGGRGADAVSKAAAALRRRGAGAGLSRAALGHRLVLADRRRAWSGQASTAVRLLSSVSAGLTSRPRRPSTAEVWERGPETGESRRTLELLAVKPVSKIEPIRRSELKGWLSCGLPNPLAQRREPCGEAEPVWELFTGRRRADVERAAALTARLNRRGCPPSVVGDIGKLLGYPACCSLAYADQPRAVKAHSFWSHAANRAAEPGAVAPEFSPLNTAIEYIPCSLRCGAALEMSRAAWACSPTLAARVDPARLKNPFLFIWGEQGSGVELLPVDEPGERFRYRAGEAYGRGPDVEAAAAGDELILGEETIEVRREGRPWASLSGRAFLWWHRRAFQAELWKGLAALRDAPRSPERRPAGKARKEVSLALARVDADFARLHGGACRSRCEENRLTVSVDGREWPLSLERDGARPGPFFARTGKLRVCVCGEPGMSPTEEERLKAYIRLLAGCDDALAAHLDRPGPNRRPK